MCELYLKLEEVICKLCRKNSDANFFKSFHGNTLIVAHWLHDCSISVSSPAAETLRADFLTSSVCGQFFPFAPPILQLVRFHSHNGQMLWHFRTSWLTSDATPPHQRPRVWVTESLGPDICCATGRNHEEFCANFSNKRRLVCQARQAGLVLQHNYCRSYFFLFFSLRHSCTVRLWPECRSVPGIFLHVIIINAKRCSTLSRLINATLLDYCWMYFTTSVLCAVLYVQYISLRFSPNACKTAICTFRISAANESLSASERCARLRSSLTLRTIVSGLNFSSQPLELWAI